MGQGRRSGLGCVATALLVLGIALGLAWALGAVDRLIYLAQVEMGRTTLAQQAATLTVEATSDYVFAQLDAADQEKYLVLLDAFKSREGRAYPETEMDDLSRMRDCVLADHPGLFYISGVEMQTLSNQGSGLVTGVTVEGQYACSEEDAIALQSAMEAAAAECLAGLPEGAGDYEKAKFFYEWLAGNVEYDHYGDGGAFEGSSGQTAADALVARRAVCAGYARAYQYLLGQAGVPCVYVTGSAKGGSHAWCAVFLDGAWYFVDPTWGDPQFLGEGGETLDDGRVNYDYFCVTGEDIAKTHVADCRYPIPECVSNADNYFVREGLYVTEPDIGQAGRIIAEAAERGDPAARFRCSERGVYDSLTAALFEEQGIYRFISGNSCRYLLNDDMMTVEVLLE